MKRFFLSVLFSGLAIGSSGCSLVSESNPFAHEEDGRFLLMADAEGMRAWGDYQNGVITNGKAPDNAADTPYYELRRKHVASRKSNFQREVEARQMPTSTPPTQN